MARGASTGVGGSKGGVGKSMMRVAMLDHLLEQGSKVVLVECDTSNPDVWKAYREQVETELINLDEADGWIHLVSTCDRHREGVVVINTAARNNLAVKQYGGTLDRGLEELRSELVALWVINRQRDQPGRGGKSITLQDLADRTRAGASRWVWRRRSFLSATEQSSGGGAGGPEVLAGVLS